MRNFFLTLVALVVVGAASAQNYNLLSGQQIPVRLLNSVESNGRLQMVPSGIVDANIYDNNGNIVIQRGAPVTLSVDTQRARGVGKAGRVTVNCITTMAVDGQSIYLRGGLTASGKNREVLAIGLGVGGGIVVFPFGLFLLCIKGEEAYIPNNTVMTNIVVDDNYEIMTR